MRVSLYKRNDLLSRNSYGAFQSRYCPGWPTLETFATESIDALAGCLTIPGVSLRSDPQSEDSANVRRWAVSDSTFSYGVFLSGGISPRRVMP